MSHSLSAKKIAPMTIDTSFNFQSDTPPDKDPDTWSPTLAKYHKYLWSKPLPDGRIFALEYKNAPFYLHHFSDVGEFWLSSDTVVPSFRKRTIEGVTKDMMNFGGLGYTIGGMMVFPANKIEGQWTINQERGCTKSISDRFDLTVECIRRFYSDRTSPLTDVLNRYTDFFSLFRDFSGYVDFFHLQDIVSTDYSAVSYFSPFDEFDVTSPIPNTKDAYLEYRAHAIDFLNARNRRIQDWADQKNMS
jgi:hypothetical protein